MSSGVLLDIAGVLLDGDKTIDGAAEAVARLRSSDTPIGFLTNSTRRPKRRILDALRRAGIDVAASEVLTPAAAACTWLKQEGFKPHLLVHPDLEEDFADVPQNGPVAVVVGDAGRHFTYERMNAAFRHLVSGSPFLALAANRSFRDTDGELSLDAGAFVRALEYSSGQSPMLLGKPSPDFFLAGARSLGSLDCDPADVTMIGDDAESDIKGALEAGLGRAILVRTGKYQSGDEDRFDPKPTAVASDIEEAVELVLAGNAQTD